MVTVSRRREKDILEFLTEARREAGYETGKVKEQKMADGTKRIEYEKGKFRYEDWYQGFERFRGDERILLSEKEVWKRSYAGGVSSNINEKEDVEKLYDFLKSALRKFQPSTPFKRGPESFTDKEYRYIDVCDGDILSFRGKEMVLFKGKVAYILEYHGGIVKH